MNAPAAKSLYRAIGEIHCSADPTTPPIEEAKYCIKYIHTRITMPNTAATT